MKSDAKTIIAMPAAGVELGSFLSSEKWRLLTQGQQTVSLLTLEKEFEEGHCRTVRVQADGVRIHREPSLFSTGSAAPTTRG